MDQYSENPGGDTSGDTSAQNTDSEPDTTDQNEDQEGETFLVSKSNLGGTDPQPGDVCKFKVVRVHDDEVEFEWVSDDNKNEDSNPDMQKASGELDTMAA